LIDCNLSVNLGADDLQSISEVLDVSSHGVDDVNLIFYVQWSWWWRWWWWWWWWSRNC